MPEGAAVSFINSAIAALLIGFPARDPMNKYGFPSSTGNDREFGSLFRQGMRRSFPAFIRSGGTVHTFARQSISARRAFVSSLVRQATSAVNSRARAEDALTLPQAGHECRNVSVGQGGVVLDLMDLHSRR